MNSRFDEGQPIFQQIADMIEDDILNGTYQADDQIISMSQFASTFQVNPATAVKALPCLSMKGSCTRKGARHVCAEVPNRSY